MTKISNQYSLTNILTADLANSRLGINNVSPAYSLDLTGTARVSGASLFNGNVTVDKSSPNISLNAPSGTGGQYNINNGVGSLMWAMYSVTGGSNAQGNWQLYSAGKTGGAGNVIDITPAGNVTFIGGNGNINFTSSATITNTGSSAYTAIYANGGGIYFGGSASVNHLSIASTGAATFSSSVTAIQGIFSGSAAERVRMTRTSIGSWDLAISGSNGFSIYDVAGAAERISITSSGNVGIGTSSPTNKLVVNNGASTNYLQIIGQSRTMYLGQDSIGAIIYSDGAVPMYFLTNAVERMRITSGGNVGIGTTSPSARLGVSGSGTDSFAISIDAANSTANGMTIYLPGNRSSDTTYRAITLGDDSAVRFRVFGNGNVQNTNGSYGTISDISIKENITDATAKLSDILKLKVRNFNFIGEASKQIGFIAQELEQVFPKLIDIDGETKLKSVKTSILIPMLVKSIQELSAKVSLLENK